jgi:alkylation response protein AidB-like acyl-CoA dehydrogenase
VSAAKYKSSWMTEESEIYRDSVRSFLENEFLPHQESWRRQHMPDRAAWKQAGDVGILLPDLPEEYGGSGGTFAHQAVVLEELAYAGIQFGHSLQSIVGRYILAFGTEEQKKRWLPRMATGDLVAAIGMTEPGAGSDLQGLKTTARREGDEYVINGTKTFITNGYHAGIVCLAVRTDPAAIPARAISLIMVETEGLAGYRAGSPFEKVGMHAQDTCELFFDEVRVPAANLLGPAEGKGLTQMMSQLSYERLTVGVTAVATMESAVAETTAYVKERKAFGKPLFELQNTRFKLAECATDARVARTFIDDCISRYIAGELDDTTIAMAKFWLTERQCRVVDECVQLHGGYGYMMEYPIARMWVDGRVQRIYAGSNEILKEMISWSL